MNPLEGEHVFAEPWEAEAFAMAVKLNEAGIFTWAEWAGALGREIAAAPTRAYYESWLAALEAILRDKRIIGETERHSRIAAWDHAARHTPHGQPIVLSSD